MQDQSQRRQGRFWEIDFLRGCSVILMVGFHLAYDLFVFSAGPGGAKPNLAPLDGPIYLIWQRVTAILFLVVAGVSLTLQGSVRHGAWRAPGRQFSRFLIRGVRIFGWGMGITVVTRLAMGRGFVVFGILHLIGLSIVLSYPFVNQRYANLAWGSAAIGLGIILNRLDGSFPWLVWLGIVPRPFFSVDFFPLLPWFGFILWGISLGNILYGGGERRWRLPERPPGATGWLCFLGRNSLAVYLIHQPLLILILILWHGGVWKL